MKVIMTSAALLAMAAAAPACAQQAGVTVHGQVNPPTGAPATVPSVAAQVPGAAVTTPTPNAGDASHAAVINPSKGQAEEGRSLSPGAIQDSRTLSTGQAVDTSANVSDSGAASQAMLRGGMRITDLGGAMDLGRVVSVAKDKAGKVSSVIVQTGDGVRRIMKPGGLTVKGGAAVTTQSEADLVALPVAK